MDWNLISEGKNSKSFDLSGPIEVKPYPKMLVALSGDEKKSKLRIDQKYGEQERNYVRYEIECDSTLICRGNRSELIEGKTSSTKLSFPPAIIATGKIGRREIFYYRSLKSGFSYQFIQYELKNGKSAGMELSCHG